MAFQGNFLGSIYPDPLIQLAITVNPSEKHLGPVAMQIAQTRHFRTSQLQHWPLNIDRRRGEGLPPPRCFVVWHFSRVFFVGPFFFSAKRGWGWKTSRITPTFLRRFGSPGPPVLFFWEGSWGDFSLVEIPNRFCDVKKQKC